MSLSDEQYKIVCKICGTHNEQTAVFCANGKCGAFLEWEGEVVGPANAPPTRDASPVSETKLVDEAQQATRTTTTQPVGVSPSPAGLPRLASTRAPRSGWRASADSAAVPAHGGDVANGKALW